MNFTKTQLEKMSIPDLDIDYYMEEISKMPDNEWFLPTNNESNNYSICAHLYEMNLISRKTIPDWVNGSFRGHKVYFKFLQS